METYPRPRRGRSRPGRVLALPLSGTRARVHTDGTVELLGGPSVRLGPAARPGPGKALTEGALPVAEWCETHGRISFRCSAFAGERGAFERVEIENPFREARELDLAADVMVPGEAGRMRMDGTVLRGARGEALVSFVGAAVSRARLPRSRGAAARIDLRVVLPPRGKRVVEVAMALPGGGVRPHGFTRELNATRARWDALLGRLGSAAVPDEALAAAFARALSALAGSLAPAGPHPDGLWPRPGLPPRSGPATLDAIVLRAIDLWGGAALVDGCLAAAFDAQGTAAPPGEHFRQAEGYLSAPQGDGPRERWASDCGSLLWVASSRRDVGAPASRFREAKPHILAACEWIMGEIASGGLMPPARAPKGLAAAGRAWTDGWSWRGLDAAAAAFDHAGDRSAERLRSAADAYRERILGDWGGDPRARACLETVHMVARPGDSGRRRGRLSGGLVAAAESLASGNLDPEGEVREAAAFLLSLRKILVEDTGTTLCLFPGAPREWFAGGRAPGFERLPTRFGPVSTRAISTRSAARIIAEVELPKLPRGFGVELSLGPPVGGVVKEVRVDGRRWRRFRPRVGTVELPPRRVLEVVAELSR
ncbi:MAG: hypothetical protein ACYS9X_11810 [Planctomycetota bacterium]|jgi:hypothetical protein